LHPYWQLANGCKTSPALLEQTSALYSFPINYYWGKGVIGIATLVSVKETINFVLPSQMKQRRQQFLVSHNQERLFLLRKLHSRPLSSTYIL
jgi:hypothetical protein